MIKYVEVGRMNVKVEVERLLVNFKMMLRLYVVSVIISYCINKV